MFLARFCNHQYSQGKGVAANHVPPTRDCHVTHQVRLYEFVTSRKITIRPAPFSFILLYFRRVDVGTSEIKKIVVAKTIYFILFAEGPEFKS